MQDELKTRSWTNCMLWIAFITTVALIVVFSYLAYKKKLLDLGLNEIGDSLAGFAGSIAFLWIVVTVLLQSAELRLQRNEVAGLKIASEDQAESLKSSLQVQTITFMRERQDRATPELLVIRGEILRTISAFLIDKFDITLDDFIKFPEAAIEHMLGFFLKDDKLQPDGLMEITIDDINTDINHDDFLTIKNLIFLINRTWIICKPLYKDAQKFNHQDTFNAWLSEINIKWYSTHYENLINVQHAVKEVIIAEKKAHGRVINYLSNMKPSASLMEIPFSDEKIKLN